MMNTLRSAVASGPPWPERGGDRDPDCVAAPAPRTILILSDIRFFREALAEILQRADRFAVIGLAADADEALAMAPDPAPLIILVDASLPDGIAAVARVAQFLPQSQIVALALMETEPAVIAWAQAGVSGYVPRDTPLGELAELLEGILRGEQTCSRRIASSLLRRIRRAPHPAAPPESAGAQGLLTRREQQVMRQIARGLSNKEIARRLDIGLGTTKSHVHNVLKKMGVARRGQIAQSLNATPAAAAASGWDTAPRAGQSLYPASSIASLS